MPTPRIKILPLRVQYAGRPGLKFPAHSDIQRQLVRGAPLILKVEAGVVVIERC